MNQAEVSFADSDNVRKRLCKKKQEVFKKRRTRWGK